MKILIVEDDHDVAEMIKSGLSADHTVETALDGADASFLARSFDYDAIVLDYSLPKKNGLVVCSEIRSAGKTTPIIFLSATGDTDIKVAALDKGADDYLTKPFSIDELKARLRALNRRPANIVHPILKVGNLSLDTDRHLVTKNDSPLRLTRKEFNLLEYLMRNAGRVLSRAQIMEHVWTADKDPFSNTVEAHILNLRRKINDKNKPSLITNVTGRGYMISADKMEN